MIIKNQVLSSLLTIAAEAASEVMNVYSRPFSVDFKTPEDPVTEADRRANTLITQRLAAEFADIPVVAEETPAQLWGQRKRADRIFFVDPVDGTREFVARNDHFSIMIGLVEGAHPSIGVIWSPALGQVWAASPEDGAFKFKVSTEILSLSRISDISKAKPIHVSETRELSQSTFLLSPRFDAQASERYLGHKIPPEQRILIGGAGLKAAFVADSQGDIYATPQHQGSRWDCCAPEAIVRAAGGKYTDATGIPLDYRCDNVKNERGIIATNALLHEACIEVMKPLLPKSLR